MYNGQMWLLMSEGYDKQITAPILLIANTLFKNRPSLICCSQVTHNYNHHSQHLILHSILIIKTAKFTCTSKFQLF